MRNPNEAREGVTQEKEENLSLASPSKSFPFGARCDLDTGLLRGFSLYLAPFFASYVIR